MIKRVFSAFLLSGMLLMAAPHAAFAEGKTVKKTHPTQPCRAKRCHHK